MLPGDPSRTLGRGRFNTKEQLEGSAPSMDLTSALPQQFLTYLKNTLTGDLGVSYAIGCRSAT